MTRLIAIPAFLAACCLLAPGAIRADEPPLTLEEAISVAIASNPSLAAARLQLPVARAAIGVAKQIPNPDLSVSDGKDTPHETLDLSFPIETGGKRGKRIQLANAGVGTGEAVLSRQMLELRNQVRRAFYALLAAERKATEAGALRELAGRARDATADRFKSGDAPKLELLQTELGAAQTKNEAAAAKAQFETRRVELNTLLGRPPDVKTTVEGNLGTGNLPDLDTAVRTALANNRDLAVLDGQIREQTARVNLARAQRSPDLGLTGTVMHDDPGAFTWGWRLGVSLTLPVFHNHGAEAVLEEATLTQLQAQREAQVASLRGAVASAWALADARGLQYATYRDGILQTAAEVESMAEEAYRAGQTGLPAMIQAITAVRDTRDRAILAGLAYQEALADLESAIGAPLP